MSIQMLATAVGVLVLLTVAPDCTVRWDISCGSTVCGVLGLGVIFFFKSQPESF